MIEVIKHNGSGGYFPRPNGFREVFRPRDVHFSNIGFKHVRGSTSAQRNGKRYEKKVLAWLESESEATDGIGFIPSPWIGFADGRARDRLCQPDALIVEEKVCTIVEVKRAHTVLAWWQLRRLYLPVVQALFPDKSIQVLEITASFDPRLPWPEDIAYLASLSARVQLGSMYGAMQWRR